MASYTQVEAIPFSQFEQLVDDGKVAEVSVSQDTIQGKLKDKLPSGKTAFVTTRVEPQLAAKLEAKGVAVTGVPSGGFAQTLISWILPAASPSSRCMPGRFASLRMSISTGWPR